MPIIAKNAGRPKHHVDGGAGGRWKHTHITTQRDEFGVVFNNIIMVLLILLSLLLSDATDKHSIRPGRCYNN